MKDVQAVALNSSALSVIWSVNSSSQQSHFLVNILYKAVNKGIACIKWRNIAKGAG